MPSEQTDDYTLSHLRVAVEHNSSVLETLLRSIQDIQCLSIKMDRRVGSLEVDVRDLVARISDQSDRSSEESGIKMNSWVSKLPHLQATPNHCNKDEMLDFVNSTPACLKSQKNEENVNNEEENRQQLSEILSELCLVKESVAAPLSEMTLRMTKMDERVESLEGGVKSVQGIVKENKSMLEFVQTHVPLKNELTDTLASLSTTLGQQQSHLTQCLAKEKGELDNSLKSLSEAGEKQLSAIESINKEFNLGGNMHKMMADQSRAVVDQIVAEAQIIREVVEETRVLRRSTECDFHIMNFSKLVGSGVQMYSRVWYIDQAKRYVKGFMLFKYDMSASIWLVHGQYPLITGQEAREGGKIKVKVSALRQEGEGDNWDFGKRELSLDETGINVQSDGWKSAWGCRVANVSCEELVSRGMICEDRLVLRYEVSVA